jgi:hypothetical protein
MRTKDEEIICLKKTIEELEKKLAQKEAELTQMVLLWSQVVRSPK